MSLMLLARHVENLFVGIELVKDKSKVGYVVVTLRTLTGVYRLL